MTSSNSVITAEIAVSEIDYSRDKIATRFEREPPESEEMQELIHSVKRSGIIEPLILRPKGATRYEVVAGNRRLQAAKAARLGSVPAVVKELDDIHARRIALIENIIRKGLVAMSQAKAISAVYEDIGIDKQSAISKVKHMYNAEVRGSPTKSPSRTLGRGGISKEEAQPTPEFLDAFNEIALSANTQYQLLQLVALPENIQDELEETKLSRQKATLLTHSKLGDDSDLKELVLDKIKSKGVRFSDALQTTRNIEKDLENNALTKRKYSDGTVTWSKDYYARDRTDESKLKSAMFDVEIPGLTELIMKTIGALLDRPLARGEIEFKPGVYEPKIKELEKKLSTIKQRQKTMFWSFYVHAAILQKICRVIVDSDK